MSDEQERESATPPPGTFARLGADLDALVRKMATSNEACQHFANARLEVLKGLRAVIDARIERLSSETDRGVSIKVE